MDVEAVDGGGGRYARQRGPMFNTGELAAA